jgi:hypothetical protein
VTSRRLTFSESSSPASVRSSRPSDRNARREHQRPSRSHLQCSPEYGRIHEPVAHPGDDTEFDEDGRISPLSAATKSQNRRDERQPLQKAFTGRISFSYCRIADRPPTTLLRQNGWPAKSPRTMQCLISCPSGWKRCRRTVRRPAAAAGSRPTARSSRNRSMARYTV